MGQAIRSKTCFLCLLLATLEAQKAVQSEVVATLATAYYQLLMLDETEKVLEQTIEFRTKSLELPNNSKMQVLLPK